MSSRLDTIITNRNRLKLFHKIKYGIKGVSDHSPVIAFIHIRENNNRRMIRVDPVQLALLEPKYNISARIVEFLNFNADPDLQEAYWEVTKGFIRDTYISSKIQHNREINRKMNDLEQDIKKKEQDYIDNPTVENKERWLALQSQFTDLTNINAGRKIFANSRRLAMEANVSSKVLANIVKNQKNRNTIHSIMKEGKLITDGVGIAECFAEYFKNLYTTRRKEGEDQVANFLQNIQLPKLIQEEKEGLDGIPFEVYQMYGDILIDHLLMVWKDAQVKGVLPRSMREALIVLIPKPDRDPKSVESYRPISLICTDCKLLAKILAERLKVVIRKLIHVDQNGFMPGASPTDNIRRLFLNLQLTPFNSGERNILMLDASKAFDSLEWDFFMDDYGKYGFWSEIYLLGQTAI